MESKIIVALDTEDISVALDLVQRLQGVVGIFKVGSQLFTAQGPEVIKRIQEKGAEVFLDLKFHDIPNTVSHAVEAACRFNPLMLTVHTLGGSDMLRAAKDARDLAGTETKLLGVTILTSLDKAQIEEIGLSASMNEEVMCLAQMARGAGLDGIVASPQEVSVLRQALGDEFLIVSPGIRPKGPMGDDQRRVMSAKEAMLAGANYLVVGRPITQAADPAAAAQSIIGELV